MASNTIGDFIKSVFPSLVNKNGVVFKALLADENGEGTLEKNFQDVENERLSWCENNSIYSQSGGQLEKSLNCFSILKKLLNENEESFLARNKLLFFRENDSVWGTKWNTLKIFKKFFNNNNVWIVNSCKDYSNSLLINGNFETQAGWILQNCQYEKEARFEGARGLLFNAGGTCRQSVAIEKDSSYFLHFFLQGNIRVQIIDNNGRYWNKDIGEFGSWSNAETFISFNSSEWDNKSLFFITDYEVASVSVVFLYEPDCYGFLDYIRLFKKTQTSTFTMIAIFEGFYSDKTANLAPGKDDPIVSFNFEEMGFYSPTFEEETDEDVLTYADEKKALAPVSPTDKDDFESVDYNKVSYFDSAFVFGASGTEAEAFYKEILDVVQPAGVFSTVELLIRE